jgi:hypothetical protein
MAATIMADAAARRRKLVAGLAIAAGVILLLLANAHLLYVSTTSQPACVPHLKAPGTEAGSYRAAQSAC